VSLGVEGLKKIKDAIIKAIKLQEDFDKI